MFQARESEEEEDEGATVDSAVCSGSMAESTSLNLEPRSEAADPTVSTQNAPCPLLASSVQTCDQCRGFIVFMTGLLRTGISCWRSLLFLLSCLVLLVDLILFFRFL